MLPPLRTTLAAAALALAGLAGTASAMPNASLSAPLDAGSDPAVEAVAGKFCYPRLKWTYVRGVGLRLIGVGFICIPTLMVPVRPPWPGPDPERIAPRIRV